MFLFSAFKQKRNASAKKMSEALNIPSTQYPTEDNWAHLKKQNKKKNSRR